MMVKKMGFLSLSSLSLNLNSLHSSLPHLLRPQRPVPRPRSDRLPGPLLLGRQLRERVRVEPSLIEIILLGDARVVRRRRGAHDAVDLGKVRGAVAREQPRELCGGTRIGGLDEVDGDVRAQGAKGQGERRRRGIVGEEELAAGPGPGGREQAAEPTRSC